MADYAAETDTGEEASPEAVARQWITELDLADKDKERQKWLKRCKEIVRLYKDDRATGDTIKKRFALFWSNIQTISPAVYARTPTPVVGRRFKDNDPVGRLASEVLERALIFAVDEGDFSSLMLGVRDEYLLLAQGQGWVRYVPTMRTEDGQAKSDEISDSPEPYEVVDWEEVIADRLHWEDYLHNPARSWPEVRWNARRAFMTRDEMKPRFPDCWEEIPLDWAPQEDGTKKEVTDNQKKAAIYEIWDKVSGKVYWISKSYPTKPLDVRDDPLQLKGFFPCPKPLFGTLGPDSLVPIPDYIYYQDQAEEIDNLTTRIDQLIDALKVRGFYAGSAKDDLDEMLKSSNNTLIPVDSWAVMMDAGGVKGLIEWFPIDQVANVLKGCFEARKQLIEDVYQVTGISDIQRGDSDPNETAAAQQLKATWGSVRVRDRQKEIQRFSRDIIRIMGEIIASRFDQKTLAEMTGVQLMTKEERDQALAQIQAQTPPPVPGQPPAPPPPVPPQLQQQLSQPTWDDVMGLLKNPKLRAFRIDIETDSTIEPNDQEEKQRRIEFLTAVGKFVGESLPVVQAAPQMLPVVMESLKWLVRGFRVGREMEDTIDRAADALEQAAQTPPPPPQDPNAQANMLKAQAAMGQVQNEAQANKIEMAKAQSDAQIESAKVQSTHQIGIAQVQAEQQRTMAENQQLTQQHIHETIQKAEDRRATKEINDSKPIKADTP